MKTLNTTTRRFFAVMFMGLALALTACGSGSSGSDAGSKASIDNAKTAYAEIQPGMNQTQIEAILGKPAVEYSSQEANGLTTTLQWKYDDGTSVGITLINGIIKAKRVSKNDATILVQVY